MFCISWPNIKHNNNRLETILIVFEIIISKLRVHLTWILETIKFVNINCQNLIVCSLLKTQKRKYNKKV